MEIFTRMEAFKQGMKRYYTGKACKNGHLSQRYVKGGMCVDCLKMHSREKYNEDNGAWVTLHLVVPRLAVPILLEYQHTCRDMVNSGKGLPPGPALPPTQAVVSDIRAHLIRIHGLAVVEQMDKLELPGMTPL